MMEYTPVSWRVTNMADLGPSAVVVNRAWSEGGTTGKELVAKDVTLTLTGQGSTTNKINAATLGFTILEQATGFRRDDSTLIVCRPSWNGSVLLCYDMKNVTDASRENPADVTDVIRGVVKGY